MESPDGYPLGAFTYYTYDPNNPRLTTATTNSRIVKTTVDGLGRTVKVETGDASSVKSVVDTEYDSCACSPLGKLKRTSRPYAPGATVYWTSYAYDALGRPTQITLPDGSVSTYAYWGNITMVTDPGGKSKTYTTDALGNLVHVTEPAPEGGNHETYYTYNLLNQLKQVQMPRGAVTQYRTFNYDLTTGRLTSATNPENGTVSYTYNTDGTPLRRTDARGQAVEFSYDQYQRVTQKRVYTWDPNNEDPCGHVDFYYDTNPLETNWPTAWGQLTAMRWGGTNCPGNQFTESYKYQAGGLINYKRLRAPILTAGNYTSSSENLDASFAYNNEGQLSQIHYPTWYDYGTPGVNQTLTYSFDTLGRPASAADQDGIQWANNATYAPDGAPTAVTFVAGYNEQFGATYYNETRSYNVRGQLTRLTSGNFADLEYGFSATNNDGRITYEKDWRSGKVINYTYDSLGRLSSAATTSPEWGQSFSYDGFGNMTAEVRTKGNTAPTIYLNYNGTTNRITTAGYGYDYSGNLTSMPNLTLTYDSDSRLTQAVHTTNGTEQYGYSPSGQRVWKHYASGSDEVFFYGVKGELLATFQYSGGPPYSTQMWHGPMYYFAGRKFYTGGVNPEDRLGSGIGNASTYFPYGDQQLFQYATYTRDYNVTNLDYAQQRYYSSQILRFTTPDPYSGSMDPQNPQSFNRYAYVQGDPVNSNDPSGLTPIIWSPFPGNPESPVLRILIEFGEFGKHLPGRALPSEGPGESRRIPGGKAKALSAAAATTERMRQQASDAVANLGPGCQGVFGDPSRDIGAATLLQALGFNAEDAKYYDAFGAEGALTLADITGSQFKGNPTLADYAPPGSGAFTIGGWAVAFNASFYTGTPQWQAAGLVHELLHLTYGGELDSQTAVRFGIPVSAASIAQEGPELAASDAIQTWLIHDCGRLP